MICYKGCLCGDDSRHALRVQCHVIYYTCTTHVYSTALCSVCMHAGGCGSQAGGTYVGVLLGYGVYLLITVIRTASCVCYTIPYVVQVVCVSTTKGKACINTIIAVTIDRQSLLLHPLNSFT